MTTTLISLIIMLPCNNKCQDKNYSWMSEVRENHENIEYYKYSVITVDSTQFSFICFSPRMLMVNFSGKLPHF